MQIRERESNKGTTLSLLLCSHSTMKRGVLFVCIVSGLWEYALGSNLKPISLMITMFQCRICLMRHKNPASSMVMLINAILIRQLNIIVVIFPPLLSSLIRQDYENKIFAVFFSISHPPNLRLGKP